MHVVQLPTFHSLLTYHGHSASVTAISISPFPPPLPVASKPEASNWLAAQLGSSTPTKPSSVYSDTPSAAAAARKPPQPSPSKPHNKPSGPPPIPNVPSNQIHVGTASLDGHVCVQSLVDLRDVSLRNFARPVKAVALSPEFRSDRTYLSGGLAGQLVLTVGAGPGAATSSTTGGAAAVAQAASGWLGAVGLGGGGSGSGRDTVLHQGEGTVSCIRWSGTGRFVAWLNETGIKIMRTNLKLDSAGAESQEDAWKRIGHVDRPQTREWDEMAGLWQGRAEWIDETALEVGEDVDEEDKAESVVAPSPAKEMLKEQAARDKKKMERLLVGWGGMIWIIHVHAGSVGTGRNVGEKTTGRAEIVKM